MRKLVQAVVLGTAIGIAALIPSRPVQSAPATVPASAPVSAPLPPGYYQAYLWAIRVDDEGTANLLTYVMYNGQAIVYESPALDITNSPNPPKPR